VTIELRRLLWGAGAAIISVGALAGLIAVVSKDRFDERHVRILATVWVALLCGSALMAGLRLLERGMWPLFGAALAIAAPIAFVLHAIPIWDDDRETERWARIVLSAFFLVISGLTVASLRLAVAAVDRIVLAAVLAVAAALALVNAIGLYYVWTYEPFNGEDSSSLVDWGGRLLVALFLLAVTGYLTAPMIERLRAPLTQERN
jgi:hypothetical protein